MTLCLLGVLLALAPLHPARAQETVAEVRRKAQMALAQGAYADAIGYLQQLVEWFGESKRETTFVQMQVVYYQLGMSHFLIGQFAEARSVFEVYLKKYPNGPHAQEVAVFIGDTYRFENRLPQALKSYITTLKRYPLGPDLKADVFMSMARCYLAQDKWNKAMPVLLRLYQVAPDFARRNWAATLLTTAYLKERKLEKVYRLVPYLLLPDSFAGRSVALNMAALETGDELFAEERYREALWIYRLIYPHDVIMTRSQAYLARLEKKAERLRRVPDTPRLLLRIQEAIGELEEEIKALAKVENYDMELNFRMARAYMEIRRYREARDLYLFLHEDAPEPRAEEALYSAFLCATHIQPWDQAFELGRQYMEAYPGKEYYDDVTLMLGQMYAKLEDWPNVIQVLTKALEVSPQHKEAAECMFLIGYASFMEEKFADAVRWLERMNSSYPGNAREADGTYWTGMAYMFDQKFEEAASEFDTVLSRFADSPYVMDAAFRRATCEYGLSRFREAEQMLEAFLAQYPDSKLCGEALMMLGDISANFGELPKAVVRFQQVFNYDVNIEFYNYAAFRAGEILHELNEFEREVKHFEAYIERNKPGSNIPLALYWIGTAMWNLGEQRGALERFREGVEKYGVDRKALGIDLILEEWVGRNRGSESAIAEAAWRDLEALLRKAEKEGQATLALRLKRVFVFKPDLSEEQRAALLKDLLREEHLPVASAAVLDLMLDEALKQTNQTLAVKAAETIIRDFTETDYALAARMFLARQAIQNGDHETAIKHLNVIKEVFATSSEAAEALMMLGDLYLKLGEYEKADDCYKKVLSVREWRGPLWPAALYGRGEAARMQRKFDEACAYFERIYLLYAQYREWTAKAYLARADCLTRMHKYRAAAETLQEMVNSPELKERPEIAEAEKKLESLRRQAAL